MSFLAQVLPVPPDQLRALLQLLATATPTLPAELLADVKKVTAAAAKAFPALASAIGSGHVSDTLLGPTELYKIMNIIC